MRVYLPDGRRTNHSVTCTPGALHNAAQWKDEGGEPLTFRVVFKDGVTEVDSQLGKWLVEMGYAARTRLILPPRRLVA